MALDKPKYSIYREREWRNIGRPEELKWCRLAVYIANELLDLHLTSFCYNVYVYKKFMQGYITTNKGIFLYVYCHLYRFEKWVWLQKTIRKKSCRSKYENISKKRSNWWRLEPELLADGSVSGCITSVSWQRNGSKLYQCSLCWMKH